jgi:ABC-2 type transport system permease protein
MLNSITIARKELGIYFTTIIGYVGFGAFSFLMGLVFVTTLNRYQQMTQYYLGQQQPQLLERLNFNDQIVQPMLSTGYWMFLFFVPFLTMRLFAEEKSARTFELLMTAPITTLEIVLGKFFSVAFMMLVMSVIPLVFPLILHVYGTSSGPGSAVEWMPVYSGALVVFLLGLTFCAIGLLISSLTENQIVAAVLTFAVLLLAFVIPLIAGRLDGDWRVVVEYISPMSHVNRGLVGRLLLADLVYFGSAISFLLFLTHRVVESHRWR